MDREQKNSSQAKIEYLRDRVSQLEEQAAYLEQIENLKQQSAKARKQGNILEAQRAYNRAWEMERDYSNYFNSTSDVDIVESIVYETCQNIKKRNSMRKI